MGSNRLNFAAGDQGIVDWGFIKMKTLSSQLDLQKETTFTKYFPDYKQSYKSQERLIGQQAVDQLTYGKMRTQKLSYFADRFPCTIRIPTQKLMVLS